MAAHTDVSLREFFQERFSHMETKIEGLADQHVEIIRRLDITNGRIRKLEVVVGVLQFAYAIGASVVAVYIFDLMQVK